MSVVRRVYTNYDIILFSGVLIMRQCKQCRNDLPLTSFSKNGQQPSGRIKYKPICSKCEHKQKALSRMNKLTFLLGDAFKCTVCNYNKNTAALEFHHLDPSQKDFEINTNLSLENLRLELAKCICLCANCHREIHFPHLMVPQTGLEPVRDFTPGGF